MKQTLDRQAKGLYPQWNPIDAPPGALLEADNCAIDREGIISKRRGFTRYGTVLTGAKELLEFKNRLLVRQSDGTLSFDSNGAGVWTAYTGTFDGPNSKRIRSIEARLSIYLTTDGGIVSSDALATTPLAAGIERGVDLQATLSGTGGSWFTEDTQIAYRTIFVRVNANKRDIIGEPSPREVIANLKTTGLAWTRAAAVVTITHTAHGFTNGDTINLTNSSDTAALPNGAFVISNVSANVYDVTGVAAGATSGTVDDGKRSDVSLNFALPDDIVAGDFWELYKTTLSGAATIDPGDTMRKVIRREISAGEITAGTVTYVDTFSTDFLEEPLYTNAEEEGTGQENGRPPLAQDVALFKGHVFYLNTKQRHFREIQFITTAGIVVGTSTVILTRGATVETYIFSAAEDSGLLEFKIFTTLTTEAENLESTMKSLARVINRASSTWYGTYVSGFDDAPGKIRITSRTWTDTVWSITANSTATGDTFTPVLPTSGATIASDNQASTNRLYRAKFEQPDHVPQGNFDDVGSSDDAGQRILALKDVLVILKENDGSFVLTGETERDFVIKQAGPSVKLLATESASVLDNAVYCVTTQGVLRIHENGEAAVVSRPVEIDFKKIFNLTNFASLSHGASYESDRKYLFSTPDDSGDTVPTRTWAWDYLTRTWVQWDKPMNAFLVLSADDTLYGIHANDGFVLKERKSFGRSRNDYQDEDIPITITAVSTTTDSIGRTVSSLTVTYTYTGNTVTDAGGILAQGTVNSKVQSVTLISGTSFTFVLREHLTSLTAAAATYTLPIISTVRWMSESAGNPSLLKKWLECQVYLEATVSSVSKLGFQTDEQPTREFVGDLKISLQSGWGSAAWGSSPWGNESTERSIPLRTDIPREKMRSRSISVTYRHQIAREKFDITQLSLTYIQGGRRTTQAPRESA